MTQLLSARSTTPHLPHVAGIKYIAKDWAAIQGDCCLKASLSLNILLSLTDAAEVEKTASISKKASFKRVPAKPVKPAEAAKERRRSPTATAAGAQTTREASALQSAGIIVRKGQKTDAKPTRRQPSRNCKRILYGIRSSQSTHQGTKPNPKRGERSSGKASKPVLSPKESSREYGTTQERRSQLSEKTREQILSPISAQREKFRTQLVSQEDKRRIKSVVSGRRCG